jgi:predicted ATP-dependent serine protease
LASFTALYDYFEPGLEARDYLANKITYFAKIQAIKSAFKQCLTLIDKAPETDDTWMKVQERLREAMATDRNFEPGLEYFENPQERYQKMMEQILDQKRFITGWQTVDDSIDGGGFSKGEAISIIADSGVGKSVALACMAVRNCLRGFKVCYISTELAEFRVATRIDAIITNVPVHTLVEQRD